MKRLESLLPIFIYASSPSFGVPSNELLKKMKNETRYGKNDLRKIHFKYHNKIIISRKWPKKIGASLNKSGGFWMNERILIDLCVQENGMDNIKRFIDTIR